MKLTAKEIEKIKSKDEKLISDLYYKYFRLVKYVVFCIVHNDSDADDITQDVFIKAFEKIHLYDSSFHFNSRITRIAKNEAHNFITKHPDQDISFDENVLIKNDVKNTTEDLETKISKILDEEDFEIFKYHALLDLKFSEISQILELNLNSVLTKYYRAIKKIKKTIKEEDFYD